MSFLEDDQHLRPFDQGHAAGVDGRQSTLPFGPPKMRKHAMEECYSIIPADHPRWVEDSQCFQGCDCWFCEITEGMVPDENSCESNPSSSISSTTAGIVVVEPTFSDKELPELLDSGE